MGSKLETSSKILQNLNTSSTGRGADTRNQSRLGSDHSENLIDSKTNTANTINVINPVKDQTMRCSIELSSNQSSSSLLNSSSSSMSIQMSNPFQKSISLQISITECLNIYHEVKQKLNNENQPIIYKIFSYIQYPFDQFRQLTIPPTNSRAYSKKLVVFYPITCCLGFMIMTNQYLDKINLVQIKDFPATIFYQFMSCPMCILTHFLLKTNKRYLIKLYNLLSLVMVIVWLSACGEQIVQILLFINDHLYFNIIQSSASVCVVGYLWRDIKAYEVLSKIGYDIFAINGQTHNQLINFQLSFGLNVFISQVIYGNSYMKLYTGLLDGQMKIDMTYLLMIVMLMICVIHLVILSFIPVLCNRKLNSYISIYLCTIYLFSVVSVVVTAVVMSN